MAAMRFSRRPKMIKQVTICSQCMVLAKEAYKVTETTRRQKIICAICGKRRYGAECTLEKRERKNESKEAQKTKNV